MENRPKRHGRRDRVNEQRLPEFAGRPAGLYVTCIP
jgi:hypothetical protein